MEEAIQMEPHSGSGPEKRTLARTQLLPSRIIYNSLGSTSCFVTFSLLSTCNCVARTASRQQALMPTGQAEKASDWIGARPMSTSLSHSFGKRVIYCGRAARTCWRTQYAQLTGRPQTPIASSHSNLDIHRACSLGLGEREIIRPSGRMLSQQPNRRPADRLSRLA